MHHWRGRTQTGNDDLSRSDPLPPALASADGDGHTRTLLHAKMRILRRRGVFLRDIVNGGYGTRHVTLRGPTLSSPSPSPLGKVIIQSNLQIMAQQKLSTLATVTFWSKLASSLLL